MPPERIAVQLVLPHRGKGASGTGGGGLPQAMQPVAPFSTTGFATVFSSRCTKAIADVIVCDV